jgi:hypothetical protein
MVAAMGYYIRILGTRLTNIPLRDLQEVALPAVLDLSEGNSDAWEELTLKHTFGDEIAIIEKNPVSLGGLGAEELQEFLDEVPHYKPDSAVVWLQKYFLTVKVIYAFQLLNGTDVDDGWALLHRVFDTVRNHAGGIAQADGEGFSNEAGFTILWQFDESAIGQWNMGVRVGNSWVHFEMDLGNKEQRESFWRGEVAIGAKLL